MIRFAALLLASMAVPALSSADDIEDFARRFVEAEDKAWKEGIFDDLEALETPDVVFHDSLGELVGFEAHKDYINRYRTIQFEMQQDWKFLAGDGSVFAMSYVSSSRTATQSKAVNAILVFRLEDDKVAEVWVRADRRYTDLDKGPR